MRVIRSYGELGARVARLARALRGKLGLAPGDRVAVVASHSPDYLDVLYAIWHARLAPAPVHAKLHGAEHGAILANSPGPRAFVSPSLGEALAAHAPASLERLIAIGGPDFETLLVAEAMPVEPRAPNDLAWLFYTSGTTGRPKGAMLTHRVLATMSDAYRREVDPVTAGDPILHAAPMSHGSGLYIMAHVDARGINVVPESGGFDAEEIFHLFGAWPRASMFAAPTMVKRMVDCAADCTPENIRTIIWGGAPMYVEDALAALDRFGPRLAQIYGQGESPMTITRLTR